MYNNAPIRNNTLLQEAYNAGYYRALNEALGGGGGMGGVNTANRRGVNNIAGGAGQGGDMMPSPPKSPSVAPTGENARPEMIFRDGHWGWFNPQTGLWEIWNPYTEVWQ